MRVQSELNEWLLEERRPEERRPEGCRLESFEPLMSWVVAMDGPEGAPGLPSIYQGHTFRCGRQSLVQSRHSSAVCVSVLSCPHRRLL